MSRTKVWAMSEAGIAEAQRLVDLAEVAYQAAATPSDLAEAARDLAQAHDVLAMARGYDCAHHMHGAGAYGVAEGAA